jgi:hypothetical protein
MYVFTTSPLYSSLSTILHKISFKSRSLSTKKCQRNHSGIHSFNFYYFLLFDKLFVFWSFHKFH